LFVGVTNNVYDPVIRHISTHPFNEGETICDIFYPLDDCFSIKDGGFDLYL